MESVPENRPIALSIAGSDPSAGAGIQVDLRVFSKHSVFGTTVLTALTAQSPLEVTAVRGLPADFVQQQLQTLSQALPIAAAKTGMLWSADIIREVAQFLSANPSIKVVVDPVMIATSGARLISEEAVSALKEVLPLATIVTPNLDEAALLLGWERIGPSQMNEAAEHLRAMYSTAFLLKGGHLEGDPCDVLVWEEGMRSWSAPRITGVLNHGSGCMLSAAITASLAKGLDLEDAVDQALSFIRGVLANSIALTEDLRLSGVERAVL